MANSLLTPTVILREAGRVFHQKAKFLNTIDWSYDSKFGKAGAKVGQSINLRDANEFTVGTGSVLQIQDVTEAQQTLTLSTQKNIGMNFSSIDLSLTIDDFSQRYIEPAVARLVANVESDVVTQAFKATPNMVDNDTAALTFVNLATAKQRLDEALAPEGDRRSLLLCPTHSTKYLDAVKGLFAPSSTIGGQYNSGMVRDALGFNVFTSTHAVAQTTGTAAKTTGYSIDSTGTITGSTITVKSGSTTFKVGDVITIATLNAVHPETKADLGYLKQFVVTADSGASATSLKIYPALTPTGAKQNVSAAIAADQVIVKVGAGASETYTQSLAYAKDAFVFGMADLEDPSQYGQWGGTQSMDGLSMRIWRTGDIINDKFPVRLDVLYGFLSRYAKVACRIHADG